MSMTSYVLFFPCFTLMGPYMDLRYHIIFITYPAPLCDILRSSACHMNIIWILLTNFLENKTSYRLVGKPKSSSPSFSFQYKSRSLWRQLYIILYNRTYMIFLTLFPMDIFSLYVLGDIASVILLRSNPSNSMTF